MIDQYRKKPVVITAVQFTQSLRDANIFDGAALPDGVTRGAMNWHPARREVYSANFYIKTLEGDMRVDLDDWIITGVKGEHYPCKPDIFAATYEPASAAQESAPAELPIKTWQESVGYPANALAPNKRERAMMQEIADLRAALAAAPVSPQLTMPDTDIPEALELLSYVFDAWENGVDCYEDPEECAGFLGKAFQLDHELFERCCALLNRRNPPRNAALSATAAPVLSDDEKFVAEYKAISEIIFKAYPRVKGAHCASIAYGILEHMGLRHSKLNYEQQESTNEKAQ